MHFAPRIILILAGFLIAAGGLYDLLTPRLPRNLSELCDGNERAERLARELLRALGASLTAIGAAMVTIVATARSPITPLRLGLILLLVVPAESVNAIGMYRVGSPWQVPAGFVLITLIGTGAELAF